MGPMQERERFGFGFEVRTGQVMKACQAHAVKTVYSRWKSGLTLHANFAHTAYHGSSRAVKYQLTNWTFSVLEA